MRTDKGDFSVITASGSEVTVGRDAGVGNDAVGETARTEHSDIA